LYGAATPTKREDNVLQVSDTAVSVLEEARTAQEVPETFGVRLFAQTDDTGQAGLALAFAEEPADGDTVTQQHGTDIYVAPELAEPLATSMLDVEQTPEGPQLALVPQDDEEQ
jgi:Fe-S cluster assembly iron-binding protein IscA